VNGRRTDGGALRWVAAIVLVVLAGCASPDAGEPAAPAGGGTAPAGNGNLVDYRRTGGFAGLTDHLVVMRDGRAVLEGKGPRHDARLDEATMRELVATLDQAGFPSLRARYDAPTKGNDLIEHAITYQGHTVMVTDTTVPEPLRPVLAELNRVLAKVRAS
jgi:hypothetical protein